jgi:hypothetical protein
LLLFSRPLVESLFCFLRFGAIPPVNMTTSLGGESEKEEQGEDVVRGGAEWSEVGVDGSW